MKYRLRMASVVWPALFAGSAGALAGCGTSAVVGGEASDDTREVGGVSLALRLAEGIDLDSVRYEIRGDGFFRAGTADVRNAPSISLVVQGIPAGAGYTIALEAGGQGEAVSCMGSANFSITAGQITSVSVILRCQLGQGTGGIAVDADTEVCPVLDALTATTTAYVGGNLALSALARDPDEAPQDLSYDWTSTLGVLSDAATANPSLGCTQPGEGSVTLVYSDGACSQSVSVPVRCVAPGADAGQDGGSPDLDAGAPDGGALPGEIRITEWMYDGAGGEWIELTNVGAEPVDFTGYSYDDDSVTPGVFSLSGFGVVQPGESVVFTESSVEAFRATWALCGGVKLLGGYTNNIGRNDQINIFDAQNQLVDRLTYGDGNFPGSIRTTGASGWVSAAGLGQDDVYAWTLASVGDAEGSYAATGGALGSPGKSTLAQVAFDPCSQTPEDAGAPDAGSEPDGGLAYDPWPGSSEVTTVDALETFSGDLSGLTLQPATASTPEILWAVENGGSLLFRLERQGAQWLPSAGNDWAFGKGLRYPDGAGLPDSEGVTKAEWSASAIYVATERNNAASGVSRPSILRFDSDAPGATLTASHEWNLVNDLPVVGANQGLEAITWIPDSFLVANGFYDEAQLAPYDPAQYPGHGAGLFFVGLEGTGGIYAYALNHDAGTFTRVATLDSGLASLMGMEFDRDQGMLWAICDNTCGNRSHVFAIDTDASSPSAGRFVLTRRVARPTGLPNLNNEGLALASDATCSAGEKSVLWSDDGDTAGYSLRAGTVSCGGP